MTDATAVVLGGASGIGLAIAKAFAVEGASVAVVDRSEKVQEMAAAIGKEHGVRALGLVADVTDYAALRQAAAEIESEFGAAEHLAYAAGMGSGKFGFPFWNLAPADWEPVLRVNLIGAVNAAHAFAPAMVAAGRGTMLFISSVAGQIGSQTDPPYSAAKAGLINFAQCAAKDLAPASVRVNTICPGMVQTPLNRSVWQAWHDQQPPEKRQTYDEWAGAKLKTVCPLGRWQEPEDVAALAVFLASEKAKNITGQTMNVDGGFVMHW
ncbi:MAG TPA: SDR family oxidoreductase [Pirellulaceae bacterium]|nr:SDR family oxidoreductase [Pirellulaceae bacterium]